MKYGIFKELALCLQKKYFGKYYISDYMTQKRKQIKLFVDNLDDSYFESYDNDSLLEFIREKTKINFVEIHDLDNPKIEMSQKTEKEEDVTTFVRLLSLKPLR